MKETAFTTFKEAKMLNEKFKIVGLLVVVFGLSSIELNACMCIPDEVETADYEYYDEVFMGKLIKMEQVKMEMEHEDGSYEMTGIEHTFEVLKKWKGSNKRIIKIREFNIGCSTGYHFSRGKWLVATQFDDGVLPYLKESNRKPFLHSNMCSLNLHLYEEENEKKAINYLDQIFPKEIPLTNTMNALKMAFVFGIAASLLSFFIYLKFKT